MKTFLRFFYHQLYHQFASFYDIIAFIVSMGEWNGWIKEIIPFIEGNEILEVGHGPGHMQVALKSLGKHIMGLDESAQMGRLAKGNIQQTMRERVHPDNICLVRGICEQIPFQHKTFDTVFATFPAPFIYSPVAISEISRVLVDGGMLVILVGVWITGKGFSHWVLKWLYRITFQSPPSTESSASVALPFLQANLTCETRLIELKNCRLFYIFAQKTNPFPMEE
jgi:ubiquinone/menaquinone biosynthesis C-methylase UbiE